MPHVIYAPAGEKDLPRLREIFLRCFGEEAAPEMEYVFARCGDALWKAERDGIPAAMLVAMPVTIALPEGEWKARYFYGVATHPEARRQGLCENLLAACCRWMTGQGEAAALLRPDSEKNRSYYRKNGFADCSTADFSCKRNGCGCTAAICGCWGSPPTRGAVRQSAGRGKSPFCGSCCAIKPMPKKHWRGCAGRCKPRNWDWRCRSPARWRA